MTRYSFTIDIERQEDIAALKSVIEELGFSVSTVRQTFTKQSRPSSKTRMGKLVLRLMSERRYVTVQDLAPDVEEADYRASGLASMLHDLMVEGVVRRVSSGCYTLSRNVQ